MVPSSRSAPLINILVCTAVHVYTEQKQRESTRNIDVETGCEIASWGYFSQREPSQRHCCVSETIYRDQLDCRSEWKQRWVMLVVTAAPLNCRNRPRRCRMMSAGVGLGRRARTALGRRRAGCDAVQSRQVASRTRRYCRWCRGTSPPDKYHHSYNTISEVPMYSYIRVV